MDLRNIALAAALLAGTAVAVPQSRQTIYDGLNAAGVRAYGKQVFEKIEAGKPLTPYETSAFHQITSGSLDGCYEK